MGRMYVRLILLLKTCALLAICSAFAVFWTSCGLKSTVWVDYADASWTFKYNVVYYQYTTINSILEYCSILLLLLLL